MPKPIKFSYEKKSPFRDAFFFVIVCEGSNREPEYFNFFVGLSSRVKIIPVASNNGSAPKLLIDSAIDLETRLELKSEVDQVWFVIDTDRWREQLHDIRKECSERLHWNVVQSNPCFEVWLYFHAKKSIPSHIDISKCKEWKPFLPTVIQGGFNNDFHPASIETAIMNSKESYSEDGYFPRIGCTQVWQLAERLLLLIKNDLDKISGQFPPPIVIS